MSRNQYTKYTNPKKMAGEFRHFLNYYLLIKPFRREPAEKLYVIN